MGNIHPQTDPREGAQPRARQTPDASEPALRGSIEAQWRAGPICSDDKRPLPDARREIDRRQWLKLKGPSPDLEAVLSAAEGAEALVVLEVPVTVSHRKRIAELASTHRLLSMFIGGQTVADAGGVIAYGTSIRDTTPRLPEYVDKVLKGAKPADLPIDVITRHQLIVNLPAARTIGVAIPPEVLNRADKIIE